MRKGAQKIQLDSAYRGLYIGSRHQKMQCDKIRDRRTKAPGTDDKKDRTES